jgi:pilus assembly protein TadC
VSASAQALAAPALAAAAAVCVVAAVGARRSPVLADVAPSAARAPDLIEGVGRTRPVRFAIAAERLEASIAAARVRLDGARIGGAAALLATLLVASAIAVGGAAIVLAAVLGPLALRTPAFVVGRAARQRRRAIDRDVPLLLDVLSLASFAGLPPPAALRRAVSVVDGPLADEVRAALEDVELGARWRDRLLELAEEVPVPDLARTVAVLVRTESIGAPTAEPIAILADEVRAARRNDASERARKAPVQMLFPLVFLVLPAFLLLTVVPVLVATLGSIR